MLLLREGVAQSGILNSKQISETASLTELKQLMMRMLETVPIWQVVSVLAAVLWLYIAHGLLLTPRIRAIVQPLVTRQVQKGVPTVLQLQRNHHPFYDLILASTSFVVSVEFYTAFLPLLFWSGHFWLARQMTLLMALCMYAGNCVKDLVSAPRPPSPPVRRFISTAGEENSSMEFGLPSSHTINTICLSIYLIRYLSRHLDEIGSNGFWLSAIALSAIVVMVAYGRMYLGMHTPVDIAAGIVIGICLLVFWCSIEDYVDLFILQGENVLSFWTSISLLLLAAYPTPAQPTPSFEYHTAFTGVVLGVVWATNRMKHCLPTEVLLIGTWSGSLVLIKRLLIGLPIVLTTKTISKFLVILIFPRVCTWAGVSIRSSSYISKLYGQGIAARREKVAPSTIQESLKSKKSPCWLKLFAAVYQEPLDIDIGIRLFQYAVLSWSVVELAPCIFKRLNL